MKEDIMNIIKVLNKRETLPLLDFKEIQSTINLFHT